MTDAIDRLNVSDEVRACLREIKAEMEGQLADAISAERLRLGAIVSDVVRDRNATRAKLAAMHRRAQKLEGIDQRFETVKENMKGYAIAMHRLGARKGWFWHDRYRAAVDQVRASGVDARHRNPDGSDAGCKTGYLDVLIARLIAERDEARTRPCPHEMARRWLRGEDGP